MKSYFLCLILFLFPGLPVVFRVLSLDPGLPPVACLYQSGRLFALAGFLLLGLQFLTGSKIKWIERGIGLGRLLRIHQYCGITAFIFLLLHPSILVVSERIQGISSPFGPGRILGLAAVLLLLITAGSALLHERVGLRYETWKASHLAGYGLLPLGLLHSIFMGVDLEKGPEGPLWMILTLIYLGVVIHKILRLKALRRRPFRVAEVTRETGDTWTLRFDGPRRAFRPGQFMLLELVRGGRVSASHPFTVASSPAERRLTVTIKSVGDFTSTVRDTGVSDTAYIDMPYGVFTLPEEGERDLVFIAGGIGITPFMSMLRTIREDRDRDRRRITLLWGNKTREDIPFREELEGMMSAIQGFRVVHVLSRDPDWSGEKGHIGVEIIRRHVERPRECEFFICGPPLMTRTMKRNLRGLGVSERNIHDERFSLR